MRIEGTTQVILIGGREHGRTAMVEAIMESVEKERGIILVSGPEPIIFKASPRFKDPIIYNIRNSSIRPERPERGTNHKKKRSRKRKKKR